jgi:hypothetical protein
MIGRDARSSSTASVVGTSAGTPLLMGKRHCRPPKRISAPSAPSADGADPGASHLPRTRSGEIVVRG